MNCDNCGLPLATDEEFQKIPPGEGEHLCWSRYRVKCEPEDWRARALAAEAERDQARIDMELWKQEAEARQADFAMWFRLANDERKVTKRLRRIVSQCAAAIGNGSFASEECSLEFMEGVPAEIEAEVKHLRDEVSKLKEDLQFQTTDAVWYEDAVEICQQWAYEIARSTPAPDNTVDRQGPMMNNYWRWALWEDCRADTPQQVFRVMQTLCAAQMEIGMMLALESK